MRDIISPKENYIQLLKHKPTQYVPCCITDAARFGFGKELGPWFDKGPDGGGYDAFGVEWIATAGSSVTPKPGNYVLKDISEWEKVKIPDVDDFDWKGKSESDLVQVNRDIHLVQYGIGNGVFERLIALMGTVEGIISLMEEPEYCIALMEKITDYQIAFIERVYQYYRPDAIVYYDDIATDCSLFMSPQLYRNIIKPFHTKIHTIIHDMGMYSVQHTCGKAEILIEDFLEIGADMWTSVQPCNDINSLIEKYGNQFSFEGGFDSSGTPGGEYSTVEIIKEELKRCVDQYGKYHRGFSLFPIFLNSKPDIVKRNFGVLYDFFLKYRMEQRSIDF